MENAEAQRSYIAANRCQSCRMLLENCLCAEVSPRKIKTQITVLMHSLEEHKPTNTAQLLKLAIPQTQIKIFGRLGGSEELVIPENVSPLVLFPEPCAPLLDQDYCERLKYPAMLIVPDGTWTQARKLIHKRANLFKIPRVRLDRKEPSRYRLRRSEHEGGLCTLEAIAEALAVLEGPELKESLTVLLDKMVTRVLRSRSSIRAR